MGKLNLAGALANLGGFDKIIEKLGGVADKFIHTKEDKEAFLLEAEKILVEREKLIYQDKDSARRREVDVANSNTSWLSKNIGALIAAGVLLLTFVLFYAVMFLSVQEMNREYALMILGGLITISTQIIQYYFGSSLGSKDKQGIIDRMKGL